MKKTNLKPVVAANMNQKGIVPLIIGLGAGIASSVVMAIVVMIISVMVLHNGMIAMESNVNQKFCEYFGVVPQAGQIKTITTCTGAESINLNAAVDNFVETNHGDLPDFLKDMITGYIHDALNKITGGTTEFPPNSVIYIGCETAFQEIDFFHLDGPFLPLIWTARMNTVEDCGAGGKICGGTENNVSCQEPPPNPTGKFFVCENQACVQKDCPNGQTECPNPDPAICHAGNPGASCGTTGGALDCSQPLGCQDAYSLNCGAPNVPTNQQPCQNQNPNQPVLHCPTGDLGKKCDTGLFCAGPEGCQLPGFFICDEAATGSGNTNVSTSNANTTLDLDCGQTSGTSGIFGVRCASTGFVCDIKTGTCIDPIAYLFKTDFSVADNQADTGVGLNFSPVVNADYFVPQFCVPDGGIFCPDCGDNQQLNGKDALDIDYDGFESKAGTLHFSMRNRHLLGPTNYALILYKDFQKTANAQAIKKERFVIKIDAGETGLCQSEDGTLVSAGELEPIFVEYDWDWSHIDENYCQKTVCDSTQFLISLSQRLHKIRTAYQNNNVGLADSLRDFKVNLMADGLGSDFRNDFNRFFLESTFFSVPSWFKSDSASFAKFVTDSDRLIFDPQTVSEPHTFQGVLDISFADATNSFFDSQNNPSAVITLHLVTGIKQEFDPQNALYRLPIDAGLGTEIANSRQGYGISFSGESIALQPNLTLQTVTGDVTPVAGAVWDTFSETNLDNRRGRLLEITKTPTGFEWSLAPVMATPVAIKIVGQNNQATAHYTIKTQTGAPYNATVQTSLTTWTQLAASVRPNPQDESCTGFDNQPMNIPVFENHKIVGQISSSGFQWPITTNVAPDKSIVLGGIFYVPFNETFLIQKVESQTQLITPKAFLSNVGDAASLDYSKTVSNQPTELPNGLKIQNVSDIIKLVNQNPKALCVYTSADKTVVYWNRDTLLFELNNKLESAFSEVNTYDLSNLVGGHTDWLCTNG